MQPHHPADHERGFLKRTGEPVPNPGLPPHEPRPTDVDPALARRAERQVAGMFALAALLSVVFVVAYLAIPPDATFVNFNASNLALGLTLGGALTLIGVGAIQWAKKLMADHELTEERHPAASTPEDREATLTAFRQGAEESGFGRRTLIRTSLVASLAALGLPAIVLLGDLGPLPGNVGTRTVWRRGMRVVADVTGTPIRPVDMELGQLVNAEPDILVENEEDDPGGELNLHDTELLNAKAKAAVVMVRMEPEELTPTPERAGWAVDGIVCYSKICTHVGCPISLYEQTTHHLLCPCHQSTFDLADNGKVVFGPAARSLPQLPLGVDEEGYLIAMSDFHEPVGPSYWERGQP
ncbi:MAG: Rieske 2Fe-2S domain-containing protein [Actinomycetota bacterium]|nr:Rieske 2Fe-2S domain-containing protein [Actinomycetota bacterium]